MLSHYSEQFEQMLQKQRNRCCMLYAASPVTYVFQTR